MRGTWQYVIKSKNADDYKKMILDSLWHPPHIIVNEEKTNEKTLYLEHVNEGKPLVADYIPNTMLGIGFFWNNEVKLETTEMYYQIVSEGKEPVLYQDRVLYTISDKKLRKEYLKKNYVTN